MYKILHNLFMYIFLLYKSVIFFLFNNQNLFSHFISPDWNLLVMLKSFCDWCSRGFPTWANMDQPRACDNCALIYFSTQPPQPMLQPLVVQPPLAQPTFARTQPAQPLHIDLNRPPSPESYIDLNYPPPSETSIDLNRTPELEKI